MASDPVGLSQPLLEQASQYEEERDSVLRQLRDGKQGLLGAAASQTGLSYARMRTLQLMKKTQQQSLADGSWIYRHVMQLRRFSMQTLPVALPVKAGLAAVIASLLAFAPGFMSIFNKNTAWAVVTVDIVMETNVGLTFSKGLNRTLGTLMAALLALLVDVLGNYMGSYETYFLVFCTFLGGAIPTMFKFRRPFSDRWNYAVVMAMITFHLLILTQSDEKIKLPLLRLALIAIGFVIASLVNVLFLPNFAGANINDLLATNFIRAGNVIERCVLEYCHGTVLQQHPEAHNHAANDDLHSCFHEIMQTDSEVDKLLGAARFEPPHGKFFMGYPWYLYGDLTENLRFAYYDIVALDNSLRAEIQSPMHLRTMFQTELLALGKECAEVFRSLGKSLLMMKKHELHIILERADEVAMLLQHKIAKQSDMLLQLSSQCRDESPHDHDHLGHAQTGRTDVTETTLPELHPEMAEENGQNVGKKLPDCKAAKFLERKGSIAYHWECTVQRLAALSLLKFASLLIEIAAKSKHVVSIIDELGVKARFDEASPGEMKPSKEFVSAFASL
ncbi:hypothetical protein M758_1G038400 [Ceratodon purpureus]|nr:hypothetical protein M758_1G038400 [Ceratodon purpureus]